MVVGERLRSIRESKKLSQGDIENRSGLLRCYISRVENGHTVPAIETLEKLAKALEVQTYQIFFDGDKPEGLNLPAVKNSCSKMSSKDSKLLRQFSALLPRMRDRDQKLLLHMARRCAR